VRKKNPDPRRNVVQATLTDSEIADLKRCCEETMTPVSSRVRVLILAYIQSAKSGASKPTKK